MSVISHSIGPHLAPPLLYYKVEFRHWGIKMRINRKQPLKKPASTSLKKELRRRLLIADDDTILARPLAEFFTTQGWDCRICYTVSTAKEIIEFWHPDAILVDLLLPRTNALSMLKYISSKPLLRKPRVVVMSKQSLAKGITAVQKAGASGYLLKPFLFDDALRSVDPSKARPIIKAEKPDSKIQLDATTQVMLKELHLVSLFLKQALDDRKPSENLFNLMRMVSLKVKAVRCSFIRITNPDTGVVMASNDDVSVQGLPIQLNKYPEIREVMRTLRVLIIPNVKSSELMAPVRELMAHTNFETIAVFPIFMHGKFFGVTSLRMEQRDSAQMFYIDHFGQVTAQIISLTMAETLNKRSGAA